jgi:hypothetical protein
MLPLAAARPWDQDFATSRFVMFSFPQEQYIPPGQIGKGIDKERMPEYFPPLIPAKD